MQCSQCGAENKPGSRFCRQCGNALDVVGKAAEIGSAPGRFCRACGARNAPHSKFCKSCGAALGAPATPAAPGASFQEAPAVTVPAESTPIVSEKAMVGASRDAKPELAAAKQFVEPETERAEPVFEGTLKTDDGASRRQFPVLIAGAVVVLAGLAAGGYFWSSRYAASAPPGVAASPAESAAQKEAMPAATSAEPSKRTQKLPPPPLPAAPVPVGQAEQGHSPPMAAQAVKKPSAPPKPNSVAHPVEETRVAKPSAPIKAPAPLAPPTTENTASAIAAALDECDRNGNYFERTLCKEKVKLKMCEGKWGRMPECPAQSWKEN